MNGMNIAAWFVAQIDSLLPSLPEENLSYLDPLHTVSYFPTQLGGAGPFWILPGDNSRGLQHHYHPRTERDCSINTFPLRAHNILMRRRGWLSHRQMNKYRQLHSITGPEGKAVFAKVKTDFRNRFSSSLWKTCSFNSISVDAFGFWDKAFLWRPRALTIPQMSGAWRAPWGKVSKRTRLPSLRICAELQRFRNFGLLRRHWVVNVNCWNSSTTASWVFWQLELLLCRLVVINYNQPARFHGSPLPQQPQLT